MSRRRRQMNFTASSVAAVAVFLLSACTTAPPAGPRIDPALAGLIPADTVLLVGTRIEALKRTPLYEKFLAHRSVPQIDAFAAQTGIDPKKDLWELLYLSNGSRGAVLGHG